MSVDVYNALRAIEGQAVEYISRQMLDMAPVLEIEAPEQRPALYWANRLHGKAAGADDLVTRNEVWHPLFMPLQFEALGSDE